MIWRYLARPLLFRLPPESVHHGSMWLFHHGMFPPLSSLVQWLTRVPDPRLKLRIWNLDFDNPVGLAAGFDKRAIWFNSLRRLGFSHIEVGTITGQAQSGNAKPRLFRLPRDRALINRMGFNNSGADAVARRLSRRRMDALIGINIGKTKVVSLEQAVNDYLHSFQLLFPWARYITVNVSSPNTPGLRSLQERKPLVELLTCLQQNNAIMAEKYQTGTRPILLKIAPDLDDSQIVGIAEIARETNLQGIIATNTTVARNGLATSPGELQAIGDGGLSGAPLTSRSRAVVARLFSICGPQIPLVGVGGIMNGEDAWQMICHGASLVQVYTGFVYGGPMFVKHLNQHLVRRLDETGMSCIADAVGSAVKT